MRWPGCFWGRGQAITTAGEPVPAVFYATRTFKQQVLLQTQSVIIGLAPIDDRLFLDALQQTAETPPNDSTIAQDTPETDTRNIAPSRPLPSYPPYLPALGLNIVVWLMSGVALLLSASPPLPHPILQQALGDQTSATWLVLPLIGLIILGFNHLLANRLRPDHPPLAQLLMYTAVCVQILLALAVLPLFS